MAKKTILRSLGVLDSRAMIIGNGEGNAEQVCRDTETFVEESSTASQD